MVNAEIRMLEAVDGTLVANASYDLSHEQVVSAALACAAVRIERHRGDQLDVDEVIALRALTSLCDELERLAEAGGHAHVIMPLAQIVLLHDALGEWVAGRSERDKLNEADTAALPLVRALLDPLADARELGVQAALRQAENTF